MTLARDVVTAAIAKGVTITTAESCTGGLVSAAITDITGSSAIFERGFVTYSNAAKVEMLSVEGATLDAHGAVSEDVAAQMAVGAAKAARADIAVSVTGIAGPGGSEHKPEGRVCFALYVGGTTTTVTREFGSIGRAQVRQRSVDTALSLIAAALDSL
ncbi:MAG TPA: damage-inducible protein CinA [Octadecabacter sp.]|mgnify:CR=1 FL=1|nr:damage-inducible protein CinA [Octadecabacter sp.]